MKQFNLIFKGATNAYAFFCFLFFGFIQTSCRKFVQVDPPVTSLNSANVYSSDATAAAVLTGLYTYMSAGTQPFATGINSLSIQCGLSADELTLYSGSTNLNYKSQYENSLSNQVYPTFWVSLYYFLHTINSALEGISNSNSLTPTVQQELTGEANFMRAFCDFYLVNLYGDIPLITTSNYETNSKLSRTSKTEVYNQIIQDLKDAQGLLTEDYLDATASNATTERTRPNKWVATALLARVYLYTGDYVNAEAQATAIINNL